MDRYSSELYDALRESPCFRPSLISKDGRSEPTKARMISKIHNYHLRFIEYPASVRRLDSDLFHITDHAYGHLLRALPANRTIVTCHDLMLLTMREMLHKSSWSPSVVAFRNSTSYLRRAAKIVAVSQQTQKDLVELNLARADQVEIIPPGVSAVFYNPALESREYTRQRLGMLADEVVVFSLGSLDRYKNLSVVIQVIAALKRQGIAVRLVRAGVRLSDEFMAQARALGIAEYITDLGRVEDVELRKLYAAADVFLFPSIKEGFGWPVVEAMATGLPIVTSWDEAITANVGSAALQVAHDDVEGLTESILAIIQSESLRSRLISEGKLRSQRFSWATVARSITRVYEEVLAEDLRMDKGRQADY